MPSWFHVAILIEGEKENNDVGQVEKKDNLVNRKIVLVSHCEEICLLD